MRVELLLKRMVLNPSPPRVPLPLPWLTVSLLIQEKFGLISRARRPGAPPAEKTAGDGPAVGEGPGPEGPVEATGLEVRVQRDLLLLVFEERHSSLN